MQLRNLRVRSLDIETRHLFWEVEDAEGSYFDCTIQVLRSESPEGPFHPLTELRGRYEFVDRGVPVGHRYRNLFYKLLVTNPDGETSEYVATQEPHPDLKAMEIRRHLQKLYQEFSGRRCWLLPSKTFGPRCTACWDPILQAKNKSRCPTCFDTTYFGGYLAPIEVFVDVDPSSNADQVTQVGQLQPNTTTARMGHYPSVKPGDILVEGENHRWRVISVVSTEHLRAPIMQQLHLFEIPPRDIEMMIPLRMEEAIKDVYFSPPRAYLDQQDIDDTMMQGLATLYRRQS